MPLDDRYRHGNHTWSGAHGGYTDMIEDAQYAHADGEWDVDHAPYTDVDSVDLSSDASCASLSSSADVRSSLEPRSAASSHAPSPPTPPPIDPIAITKVRGAHADPSEASFVPGQVLAAALASSTGGTAAHDIASAGSEVRRARLGVPLVLEGSMEILSGFHRRDYDRVWRGALKSEAGAVIFAGSLVASPLLIALGAVLARPYERGT